MASGFGNRTPLGRCYPLYMEFKECLTSDPGNSRCGDLSDDYMECLHHKKETIRFNEYNAERMRKAKAGEPIPANVNAQIKSGELKVPWTNVGQ